jgi:hypothetical protein
MAIRHRHNVLPKVLTKLVEITVAPNASDISVTPNVKMAKTPMNTKTDGFWAKKLRCMINLLPRGL